MVRGGAQLELELIDYWRIIVNRKEIIIILLFTALVSSYVVSELTVPVYEATTTLLIRDTNNQLDMPFLDAGALSGKNPVQNYIEILKSRQLAQMVARKLGVESDPHSPEFIHFKNQISVAPIQGTDAIRISVQSTDPQFAAKVANTMVEAFIELNQLANQEEARNARLFIEEQLEIVQQELIEAEEALNAYRTEYKVIAPTQEGASLVSELSALDKMMAETLVQISEARTRMVKLEEQLTQQDRTLMVSRSVTDNPLLTQYRSDLARLEIELAALRQKYTGAHPQVIAVEAQIEQVKQQMLAVLQEVMDDEAQATNPVYQKALQDFVASQIELIALEARLDTLQKLIEEKEQSMGELPNTEMVVQRLTRNLSVTEQLYILLLTRYEEIRISEAMKSANVQVIDEAVVPRTPIKPRKNLNLAISGMLGLFAGCGLAFLLDYVDTTLKTAEQVEQVLGIPVLGMIPNFEESKRSRKYRKRRSVRSSSVKRSM